MIKKINRKDCLILYPKFPQADNRIEEFFYPRIFKGYYLTVAPNTRRKYIKKLVNAVALLSKGLGYESLIFLGDTITPWLYRSDSDNNAYPPVRKGIDYLISHNMGRRFNGGLEVDLRELAVLLESIYWMTSANAALPVVHFMDPRQNLVGNICHHGTIHLSILNKKTDIHFLDLGKELGLIQNTECISPFSR
jgi:hypothetical protein